MNELSTTLRAMNLRPVVYYPIYKMMTGSIHGAVLLSQIMYWYSSVNRDFYKTNEELMDELHFTDRELRTAKEHIKKLPFVRMYQKGIPAKTHYGIDYDLFISLSKRMIEEKDFKSFKEVDETDKPSTDETDKPSTGETVPSITESTTENTTEKYIALSSKDATLESELTDKSKLSDSSEERKEKSCAKKKRKKHEYTDDFEEWWKIYGQGNKYNAFLEWKSFDDQPDNDELIPLTLKYIAYCKSKDRQLLDGERYLKRRTWETKWPVEHKQTNMYKEDNYWKGY